MLKIDWYLELPHDFEYKNYILLDYVQRVDQSFNLRVLSPYLLWTEKMLLELEDFNKKKIAFLSQFEKDKIQIVNGHLKFTKVNLMENEDIKTITEVVDYSVPLLKSKVKFGYKLLDKYPQILY